MGKVIVMAFITLDGIVSDPDGSGGTPNGGWAFRNGGGALAEDKFRLGDRMETATMLLGRRTWEMFAARWPGRTTEFAGRMNAMRKLVVTKSGVDTSLWANSTSTGDDPLEVVTREPGEFVTTGSLSVLRRLVGADLVDQYRLLTVPSAIGTGERLFPAPTHLRYVSAEPVGTGVLTVLERD
jgi:dihydrofolate reductase